MAYLPPNRPAMLTRLLTFLLKQELYHFVFIDILKVGGWGGIRTHETVPRLAVFKTAAFNHSATHPWGGLVRVYAARVNGILAGGLPGSLGRRRG